MKKKIFFEIDLDKNEVKVAGQDGLWMDTGYCLEATSFMLAQCREKFPTSQQAADYARNYILKAIPTYKKLGRIEKGEAQ